MLSNATVMATAAVSDLERGKEFYGGTLGLRALDAQGDEAVVYECGGGSRLLVYRSTYAGTNEATALTWEVDDVDREVAELKGKGVSFEHYDLPGMTVEGDVHVMGEMKGAWFKDPDGNILAVFSRAGA